MQFVYNFHFTRKQLSEFMYDLRTNVNAHYIDVMLSLAADSGTVVCTVSPNNIVALVNDIRLNTGKTVDEFIKEYNKVLNQPTIQNNNTIKQAIIHYVGLAN